MSDTPKAHLLVVEDDEVINESLTLRLEAEGYAVTRAVDGPGAVAAFGDAEPDLVLLDIMLPGFDGLEVCRRIQAIRPVPVLMLTARDDETDILIGLGVGADDYVTKPFRMREPSSRRHVHQRVSSWAIWASTRRLGASPWQRPMSTSPRSSSTCSSPSRRRRTGSSPGRSCCERSGGGPTPMAPAPWTPT
jgi:DNA-binding response OmpR family regulator